MSFLGESRTFRPLIKLFQNIIFSKIVLPIVLFRYKSVIWDPLEFDLQFMLYPYASTVWACSLSTYIAMY